MDEQFKSSKHIMHVGCVSFTGANVSIKALVTLRHVFSVLQTFAIISRATKAVHPGLVKLFCCHCLLDSRRNLGRYGAHR